MEIESSSESPPESLRRTPSRWRRVALYVSYLCFISFLLAEIAARIVTRADANGILHIGSLVLLPYRLEAKASTVPWADTAAQTYIKLDDRLGWSIVPSGKSELYQANSQGIRSQPDKVYTPEPPAGALRIVTVGDSFTHCDEVSNDQTWQHYLEERHHDWEVMNFGVPGYATDQAYLRWRYDASKFKANFVLLGIWPEDICRNLNIFRYYMVPDNVYLTKPRFVQRGDSLELVNSPTVQGEAVVKALTEPESSALARQDYWYDSGYCTDRWYYHSRLLRLVATVEAYRARKNNRNRHYTGEDPAAIELTTAIAMDFAREVKATGAVPIILILPMRPVVEMYPEEGSSPLVKKLKGQGLHVIDTGPSMLRMAKSHPDDNIFPAKTHLPPIANQFLSEEIGRSLAEFMKTQPGPGTSAAK